MPSQKKIVEVVYELIKRAETTLPHDVVNALRKAHSCEDNPVAKLQLETILANIKIAGERKIPMCQDTGVLVFYADLGSKLKLSPVKLVDGIASAVKKATYEVPLRPNIVHPLTRENSNDNTGWGTPIIHLDYVEGADYTDITVFPKGAGSENMSAFSMLLPSAGAEGITDFVMETVRKAGGKPCPPVIIGLGIGGTADRAMELAKKALLRSINVRSKDKKISELEEKILSKVNALGVGPMGLGGKTTALKVNIEFVGCHTASLPVAVNIQCWAARIAKARIKENKVEWLR